MPNDPRTADHEPEPELNARIFAVGDKPYCVWDWDLGRRNVEYLRSLDPAYFEYTARVNLAKLEAEDPRERQRAATAIRLAYHHGLESLFALIFAAVQAPGCVVGWMQVYAPAELRKLVKAASLSWDRAEQDKMRAYRERVQRYIWMRPREFLWEGISKRLIRPTGEEVRVRQIQERYARVWSRFARNFSTDSFVDEYNSIKHGMRVGSGGFYMAVGLEDVPGQFAPPEQMQSLGGSDYGSSFFMRRTLVEKPLEKDKRAGQGQRHFRIRRQRLNWDPKGLCEALALIYVSLHNVCAHLQVVNGVDASGLEFKVLPDEVFNSPLGQVAGVSALTEMDLPVLRSDVQLLEKEDLEREIAEQIRTARDKEDTSPPPSDP